MGNTCKPMAVSFQCMTKSTTNKKKEKKKNNFQYEAKTPPQETPKGIIFYFYLDPRIELTSLALAGGFFITMILYHLSHYGSPCNIWG